MKAESQLKQDIEEVILSEEHIAARVREIDPDTVVYPICATYDAAHREEFFSR